MESLMTTTTVTAAAGVAITAESASAATSTKTSTGTCIKGGQFCPKAKYKKAGIDAKGRKYVCKGDKNHPHWMK